MVTKEFVEGFCVGFDVIVRPINIGILVESTDEIMDNIYDKCIKCGIDYIIDFEDGIVFY